MPHPALATRAGHRTTVVIPAHDEESVIGRCLEVLLRDASADDFDVLVVSNGSTDGTADVARRAGERSAVDVEVVELERPSKIEALRHALDRCRGRAVVVLDADVELPTETARLVVRAVDRHDPVVVSARLVVDTSRCSWLVRRYYRVWTALPYANVSMVGSGLFAMSPAGTEMLGVLPDVVNDDGWVRRRFRSDQTVLVSAPFVVHAARTSRALVSRRARVVNGNRALDAELGAEDGNGHGLKQVLRTVREKPVGVLDVVAFLALTLASRGVAKVRRARGDVSWSTDRTSRVTA
ncbi:glycosyltransferase family A protein [Actinotalea sp. C106]|uniref:glycosyltransferase family 2 protein n=1 Tax=Actinotalea sp. C106 TaxID=2908644 RepID=UPI00202968C1|nr:glycosyltransferase family A protein [Actinotalea sp. C106]